MCIYIYVFIYLPTSITGTVACNPCKASSPIPRSLLWHATNHAAKCSDEGSHLSHYLHENQQGTPYWQHYSIKHYSTITYG